MRHELIRRKALLIDQFVEYYKRARGRKSFPHKEVGHLVTFLFSRSRFSGRGAFKTVYRIDSKAKNLALKTSHFKSVTNDLRAYHRLPASIRNRYFAKVYWRTKYCSLQKFGTSAAVPDDVLKKLKGVGKKYRLTDIRSANIRKVDGRFKIVDANLGR